MVVLDYLEVELDILHPKSDVKIVINNYLKEIKSPLDPN